MSLPTSPPPPPPPPLRIGYVPEHYLLPLHLADFPFPVDLIPFPSGTGHMITSFRSSSLDLAIGLTEGWVAGLLTPQGPNANGGGYRIVGRWVQNPLRWAIVTGRDREDVDSVEDLGRRNHRRVGVSRLGSGSHIMAFVLAMREGWTGTSSSSSSSSGESKALDVVPLGPLPDLIAGVAATTTTKREGQEPAAAAAAAAAAAPAADFFMWEHFTTKPHFHSPQSSSSPSSPSPPLKKISEISTPWPSWHIAASSTTFPFPATDQRLTQIFEALDHGIQTFTSDPEMAVRLLGTGELGCRYEERDAREWLGGVEFVEGTRGVDGKVLEGVVEVLKGAGVVAREVGIRHGDGVVGIERA